MKSRLSMLFLFLAFCPVIGFAGESHHELRVKIVDTREPFHIRVTAVDQLFLATRSWQQGRSLQIDLPAPGYYMVEVQFHSGMEFCKTVVVPRASDRKQELPVSLTDAVFARDLAEDAHTVALGQLKSEDKLNRSLAKFEDAMEAGNPKQAEKVLIGITERSPSLAFAWNNLGALRVQQRRTKEALEVLRHALELDPDSFEVHLNLGRSFFIGKDYGEAAESAKRALEIRSGHPNALALLATSLYLMGEHDKAFHQFARLLEQDPNHVTFPDLFLAAMLQERGELTIGARHVVDWAAKHRDHPMRAELLAKARKVLREERTQEMSAAPRRVTPTRSPGETAGLGSAFTQ